MSAFKRGLLTSTSIVFELGFIDVHVSILTEVVTAPCLKYYILYSVKSL